GRVSAIVQQFFDVDVSESQRSSNGSVDEAENGETSFVEGEHDVFGPIPLFNALLSHTRVLDDR
ncbi:MAG: hypothetical protein OEP48_14555, partial [Betaproteobacteria bacterium]|nr:hypothetical protein [Betaproteobacteria bacterium]